MSPRGIRPKRLRLAGSVRGESGSLTNCDHHLLQYARPGDSGVEGELVIGLDFGTSASKVVIQAPEIQGSPSYAVNFGEFSHASMPYLLPTTLSVTPSGTCVLGPLDGVSLIKDIKLKLFSGSEQLNSSRIAVEQDLSGETEAVAYLALLLRQARRWFLDEKRDVVGHFRRLRWSVNLGVPSPCIEDNEENRRFQRVGKAAWMLSVLPEEHITFGRANRELKHVEDPEYWETDDALTCDFDIIPEIAGGAVGYALSEFRREGLHLMVDVGASTVDVCSFMLHAREGSDRYDLLTADVQRLGTIALHDERIRALKSVYERQAEHLRDSHDPLAPIARDIEPYLVPREKLLSAGDRAEAELKERFQTMLRRVIRDAKVCRDPNAPVWRNGRLPILLIGGGSKLQFFHSAVEEVSAWVRSLAGNDGAILLPVSVPDSLVDKPGEYHRLAVAYGLSHRAMDIGSITSADDTDDIEPLPRIDLEDNYTGKEKV